MSASESESRSALVLELAEEFLARCRRGERPSVREYADRHPHLAAEIRDVFPAMAMMEDIALDEASLAPEAPAGPAARRLPLRQLGDYRIIREVGRGGMGVVYEAEQVSLGRHVALKVLPSHALLDPRQLRRFQREARSAARLHHTNIVPVFGVGEEGGLHYYVMQFIQGLGLDEVLAELKRLRQPKGPGGLTAGDRPGHTRDVPAAQVVQSLLTGTFRPPSPADAPEALNPPASGPRSESVIHLPGQTETSSLTESGRQYWQSVARVGVQVAQALEYAWQQGVLHRDIKPSNLLLDGQGNVWVTDFGLAKGEADGDNLTYTGDIVGTLRYLAPERFNDQGDVRSDLYSLGLTLYELLTLRPAFDEADRNKLVKQVMHDEPPRPRKLNVGVPRDLETIILKAMAREPGQRYQTAAELAEDLTRFVEDKPIRARRASEAERLRRWCRRNPAGAGLAAAFVLALVLGLAGVSWKWWEAEAHLREADRQRIAAARQHQEADRQRGIARDEADRTRYFLYLTNMQLAAQVWDSEEGGVQQVNDLLAAHIPRPGEKDLRDFAWRYQWNLVRNGTVTFTAPEARALQGAFCPDGRLVTVDTDRRLRCWDPDRRRAAHVLDLTAARADKHITLAGDGRTVAVSAADGSVRVLDVPSGQPRSAFQAADQGPVLLRFLPDHQTLITCPRDGLARAWEAATGTERAGIPGLQADFHARGYFGQKDAALSPDGTTLAVRSGPTNRWITLFDWRTGTERGAFPRHGLTVSSLAWSPDGRTVAAGDGAGQVIFWDVATFKQNGRPLPRQASHVVALAFSADGRRLATGARNGLVAVWDVGTRERLFQLKGHTGVISWLAFAGDGQTLASGSQDQTTKLWDLTAVGEARLFTRAGAALNALAYSPDGRRLATCEGALVRIYEAQTGRLIHTLTAHAEADLGDRRSNRATRVAFSPDGRTLATGGIESRVILWDVATGQNRAVLPGRSPDPLVLASQAVGSLAFSPDGSYLAAGFGSPTVVLANDYDQWVKVWEVRPRRGREADGAARRPPTPWRPERLPSSAATATTSWGRHSLRTGSSS